MSMPQDNPTASLIIGILYKKDLANITKIMRDKYGAFQSSEIIEFSFTKFYEKEFGTNLKKVYLGFAKIDIGKLPEIKHICYDIEYSNKKRLFNIDPGYITKNSLVLASFKPRAHRIYIGNKVYGDLQLVYENDSWKSFKWTFPDVLQILPFLTKVREQL